MLGWTRIGLVSITVFFLLIGAVAQAATDQFNVTINLDGTATVNGQPATNILKSDARLDTLTIPILKDVTGLRPRIEVIATLPVTMAAEWQPRLRPNRCSCRVIDSREGDRTFRMVAEGVNVGASLSFEAEFAPGILQLPLSARAIRSTEAAGTWFLVFALLVLLATLGFLIHLMWELYEIRKFKIKPTPLDRPPNDLAPAIISLIPSGKITNHTLAAMLISLAERGFVTLTQAGEHLVFTEAQPVDLTGPGFALGSFPTDQIPAGERAKAAKEGVTIAEKYLLAKLFTQMKRSVTEEDIAKRVGRHLSSFKIGKLYAEFYDQVTKEGYFIRNPHTVHLHYRGLGIGVFFLGLTGFIGSFFLPGDKLFLELTLVLVMLSGRIVTKMVPYLPLLTVTGQAEWARWAGFLAYLGETSPLDAAIPGSQFFTYLSYALAFDLLEPWAKRFGGRLAVAPSWYKSSPSKQTVTDFAAEIDHLRRTVAVALASIHEHTVRSTGATSLTTQPEKNYTVS